jgi:hypothetical protein
LFVVGEEECFKSVRMQVKSLFMCSSSSMGRKKRFMKKSGDEEVVVVLLQQITITHN